MPKIFNDSSTFDKDAAIPNSTLWVPANANLPNGDPMQRRTTAAATSWVADPTGFYLPASNPTGDSFLTIEVWWRMKDAGGNGENMIVRHGDGAYSTTNQNWRFFQYQQNSVYSTMLFYYFKNDGSLAMQYSSGQIATSTPLIHHWVICCKQNNNTSITLKVWRNAVLQQDYPAPASTVARRLNDTTKFVIGDGAVNGEQGTAKVALYNGEFTQADVDSHWAAMTFV